MPDDTGKKQGPEAAGNRFSKGQSGNPAGRPRGARSRATTALEDLLEGEAEAITRKAVELAKEGHPVAMKLALERILPLRRGRPVRFTFPEVEAAGDVSAALGSILKATAAGELTPDEAVTIAGVLEAKRKAIETVQIEARLAVLEKASVQKGGRR